MLCCCSSTDSPPPSELAPGSKQAKPPLKRNPRVSKENRSASSESAVHQTALAFKASWKEYCNSTAIHGVRYFVEDGRSAFERLFWVVGLAISLVGCFYLIHKVYNKWDQSPVIVSFAESSTPIWEVPFPAVTVCPMTKARQRSYNLTEMWLYGVRQNAEKRNEEELLKLEAVSLVCKFFLYSGYARRNKTSDEVLDIIREETIGLCKWLNESNCFTLKGEPLFQPVLSDAGVCYTFNMLDSTELFTKLAVQHDSEQNNSKSEGWNPESGYPTNATLHTFPRRAFGNGARSGLSIQLLAYKDDFDLCQGHVQGFKVLLHNPAEIPQIGHQYFHVHINQEVNVEVKPSMMTTSEGLRGYEPSRRQCYFP